MAFRDENIRGCIAERKVLPVKEATVPNSWLPKTGIIPLSYINQELGHELRLEVKENTKFWEC